MKNSSSTGRTRAALIARLIPRATFGITLALFLGALSAPLSAAPDPAKKQEKQDKKDNKQDKNDTDTDNQGSGAQTPGTQTPGTTSPGPKIPDIGLPGASSNAPLASPYSGITATDLVANYQDNGNGFGTTYRLVLSQAPSPSSNGQPGNQTIDTIALSQAFSGLTPNTPYYVDVQATALFATPSAFTSLGQVITLANPPTPLAPSGVSGTQIIANWGNNGNPSSTIYTVQLSPDPTFGNGVISQNTAATSVTFSNLTPNTAYYSRVLATNSAGIATDYTTLPAVTTPSTLLQAPSLSGAAQSPTTVLWTWNAVDGATGYRVVNPSGGNVSGDLPATATSFQENGLVINTPYTRSVVALSGPAGAISSPLTRYTLANPPTNVQSTEVTTSSITLRWDANGNPSYTNYRVNYWEVGGTTTSVSTPAQQLQLRGLSSGTTYFLTVQALNGDSVASAPSGAAGTGDSPFQIVTAGSRVNFGVTDAKVFPNPFRPSRGDSLVTFKNLPADTRIRLYTLAGEKVCELSTSAAGVATWDGKNDSGRAVASGVYFALLDGAGNRQTIKVAVQR